MKSKIISILLIFSIILITGCSINKVENTINTTENSTSDIYMEENDLIPLENTFWLNTTNSNEYYFYSKTLKTNFKEKTPNDVLYEGYYTITTSKKDLEQLKKFLKGSKEEVKSKFNENIKDLDNEIEFGLSINTNENESIIHEYYGLYTENKIILAEIGSDDTVYVLEKIK